MSYQAIVYKVMIASPGDVASERSLVREILVEWNTVNADSRKVILIPVGWETHVSPEMGDSPQAIINRQLLDDCDLLVGVFWTRLGTPTGEYSSGTVEEIERHIKAGKPAMLYFSAAPVVLDSVDSSQYADLKAFRDSCKSRGLYESYSDYSDFRSKFYRQLQLKLNKDPYFTKVPVSSEDELPDVVEPRRRNMPTISRDAQVLLKEASQDPSGNILQVLTRGGLSVSTNGKHMIGDRDPRKRAIWESAIIDLEKAGLIVARGSKREVFGVTREGYEVAELLNP